MRVRRVNASIEVDDGGWFSHLTSGKNCILKFQRPSKSTISGDTWWTPEIGQIDVYNPTYTSLLGSIGLSGYSNTDPVSTVTGAISGRSAVIGQFFTSGQFLDFDWVNF